MEHPHAQNQVLATTGPVATVIAVPASAGPTAFAAVNGYQAAVAVVNGGPPARISRPAP